ncbi:MAG TPA: DUF1801 domain-containing protein [Bryobacteraceae bacterium]|nr:DUF1801 domain-containing protein [Bryobacteraceae bacterium]
MSSKPAAGRPSRKTRTVPPPLPEYLGFLAPYDSRIAKLALATRQLVLEEAPDATELIYDAYNAVATGYGFTGRPSECFIHIAVYAKWVNLGFQRGSELPDPDGLLQGSGRWIRHIRIAEPEDLRRPPARQFVKEAIARAKRPIAEAPKSKSVVRAIYPRKRRPAKKA